MLLPSSLTAQGKTLVAATFPGTWDEAHREILAPAFGKRTGASVTQSMLLGTDQISRLSAAKGCRPRPVVIVQDDSFDATDPPPSRLHDGRDRCAAVPPACGTE